MQARGLWPDLGTGITTADGDAATFSYTLFWYPECAGTGDLETSHLDLAVTFDPATPLPANAS